METGTKKKPRKRYRGRWVYRHGSPKNISIKQIKKTDVRHFKKKDNAFISHGTLLPKKKGKIHNLEKVLSSTRMRILNSIFEDVLLKVMDNMIETKNYYVLPNAVDFIICTMKNKDGSNRSFFTFNTHRTMNNTVKRAERNGFIWKITPNKKIGLKLIDYNDNRKYSYIPCKQSIGKQLLASSRWKLDLLTWKLKKKGLNRSYIAQLFD